MAPAAEEEAAMLDRRTVQVYLVFALIGLFAVLVVMLSARTPQASALIVGVIVALVVPVPLIWLFRKLGVPIGRAVNCQRCGAEQPAVRKPANVRQAMLGGYACAKCGAELDASGRVRTP